MAASTWTNTSDLTYVQSMVVITCRASPPKVIFRGISASSTDRIADRVVRCSAMNQIAYADRAVALTLLLAATITVQNTNVGGIGGLLPLLLAYQGQLKLPTRQFCLMYARSHQERADDEPVTSLQRKRRRMYEMRLSSHNADQGDSEETYLRSELGKMTQQVEELTKELREVRKKYEEKTETLVGIIERLTQQPK